ncbi:hypothetical protein D3C72_1396360 [compost metagenome]
MLFDPGQVLVACGGVHHQAEIVFSKEVNDQVVDYAAGRVQHAGVQRFARLGELGDIVRQQVTQEFTGTGTAQINNGHMGDVEHTGILTHGVVLIDLGAIMQRHHPAMKIYHARTARHVLVVQWGLLCHLFPLSTQVAEDRVLLRNKAGVARGPDCAKHAGCSTQIASPMVNDANDTFALTLTPNAPINHKLK